LVLVIEVDARSEKQEEEVELVDADGVCDDVETPDEQQSEKIQHCEKASERPSSPNERSRLIQHVLILSLQFRVQLSQLSKPLLSRLFCSSGV